MMFDRSSMGTMGTGDGESIQTHSCCSSTRFPHLPQCFSICCFGCKPEMHLFLAKWKLKKNLILWVSNLNGLSHYHHTDSNQHHQAEYHQGLDHDEYALSIVSIGVHDSEATCTHPTPSQPEKRSTPTAEIPRVPP